MLVEGPAELPDTLTTFSLVGAKHE